MRDEERELWVEHTPFRWEREYKDSKVAVFYKASAWWLEMEGKTLGPFSFKDDAQARARSHFHQRGERLKPPRKRAYRGKKASTLAGEFEPFSASID